MSTVDDRYRRYVTEYEDAGDADPRPYLDGLSALDRAELAARIDRFLDTAPAPAFDPAAFERFMASPVRQRAVDQVLGLETLADLRAASTLSKRQLAEQLAEHLELADHADALRSRYHDVETGQTNPDRVSRRVWEALGEILDASLTRVRDAAGRAFGGHEGGGAVFARSAPAAAPQFNVAPESVVDDSDALVDDVFFDD